MPPTPGIFPVPNAAPSLASQLVIGPGVPGPPPFAQQTTKLTRLPGVSGVLNGPPTDASEIYRPGIGHGLHAHSHHYPPPRHATSGAMEESLGRKEKRKKDSSLRHNKDFGDRRDDSSRHITDRLSALHHTAHLLCTRPDLSLHFQLRLYPLSLERSALLAQLEAEERYAVELAQVAYEEERERVEDEWRRGRERVRERLIEGIEERRRRAREEKEGEGAIGDASLDSHSRPPITRKLRNKLGPGTSPPPTPQATVLNGLPALHLLSSTALAGSTNAGAFASTSGNLPITTGPFLNPHSLNVDDLPSPFPLPLTASALAHSSSGTLSGAINSSGAAVAVGLPGGGGPMTGSISSGIGMGAGGAGGGAGAGGVGLITAVGNGGRRRVKTGGGYQGQPLGGLGKSLAVFNIQKENMDLENDLNEIKRGNKRRRAAAASNVKG